MEGVCTEKVGRPRARDVIPGEPGAARLSPSKVPNQGKPFLSEEDFRAMLALATPRPFLGARRQAMLWVAPAQ